MNRIRKLDASTAGKIAAGEVVEKPAMVVKELVENAIDAGATEIVVDIKKGGKSSIRVSDNGSGIFAGDVPLLFERHATSKIATIDDLYHTRTLGFRGEALASICAVSQVEVVTMRAEDTVGLKVHAAGGKILKESEIGTVVGTSITVSDLFFNTPARLKFLKNDATEARYITELMSHLALSHPEIAFKYLSDQKQVFHTPGKGKLKDAIFGVYDGTTVKNLYEIEETLEDIKLHGFVSKFDYTKGTKSHQITFVNGRYVKSDFIKDVIQMAYKPYMMHNRYPVCFLFFEMPPEKLDVNIHPAKTEIKFHEEGLIKQALFTALKKSFNLYNQMPQATFTEKQVFVKNTVLSEMEKQHERFENPSPTKLSGTSDEQKPPVSFHPVKAVVEPPLTQNHIEKVALQKQDVKPEIKSMTRQEVRHHVTPSSDVRLEKPNVTKEAPIYKPEPKPVVDFDLFKEATQFVQETLTETTMDYEVQMPSETLYDGLEPIGVFDQTYLLLQKNGVLYMIDQHAAHEKVLYEQYMQDFEKQAVMSQLMLMPETIAMDVLSYAHLKDNETLLMRMGFEFEDFGSQSAVIRAIPAHMPFAVAKRLFLESLEGSLEGDDDFKLMKMASKACKAAIKGSDKLESIEVRALLNLLKTLKEPYTCPHGRPIIIQFSKYDIEKKFKRVL